MKGKYSAEKLLEQLITLEPVEFVGVCKIIGVKTVEDNVECADSNEEHDKVIMKPLEFVDIWNDVCDTIDGFNRTRRRNLGTILYAANKKEKK